MAGLPPSLDGVGDASIGRVMERVERARARLQGFIDDVPVWIGRADEAIDALEEIGTEQSPPLEQAVSLAALIRAALLDLQRHAVASRDQLDRFVIT